MAVVQQLLTHLSNIHPDNLDICVEFYLHCWNQICTNCTMLEGAWGRANYVLKLQNRIHRSWPVIELMVWGPPLFAGLQEPVIKLDELQRYN